MSPKIRFTLFVLLVAALMVTACGPSQADYNAQQTQISELQEKLTTPTPSNEQLQAQIAEMQAQLSATPSASSVISTPRPTDDAAQPISCELDKIGTWSEVSSAGPQRIEVGGHGVQQLDFYPLKGVKSISYIVPAIAPNEIPAIYYGYGSIWEGQLPACANFDFVADATNYASARLDSGHSGLVIDLRGGQFKVVANTANMSQKDIDALLAQHMAAMDPTK